MYYLCMHTCKSCKCTGDMLYSKYLLTILAVQPKEHQEETWSEEEENSEKSYEVHRELSKCHLEDHDQCQDGLKNLTFYET